LFDEDLPLGGNAFYLYQRKDISQKPTTTSSKSIV